MKKKKLIIIGVVLFVTIIVAVITINQVSKWSEMSFEAIVQETVTQSDGEIRLIVERTTEIYGSPFNSLLISDSTKLVDEEDNIISITDFSRGDTVILILDLAEWRNILIFKELKRYHARMGNWKLGAAILYGRY